jgi:hypothetical protein
LKLKGVNSWINRQIGDEQLPEDSDRNANGTLKGWSKWLEERSDRNGPTASPMGCCTFTSLA